MDNAHEPDYDTKEKLGEGLPGPHRRARHTTGLVAVVRGVWSVQGVSPYTAEDTPIRQAFS